MKIKFIKASELDKNLKATIHKSGKFGFTIEAAGKLGLNETKSISIGVNEDDLEDANLYVAVNNGVEKDAFKVNKAGGYYYVNTKLLFDNLKIDYANKSIMFDIVEEKIDDAIIYVFKRREIMKKEVE